jgi:hypothetical protein
MTDGHLKPIEYPVPSAVVEESKPPGMWASIALVFYSIAMNIQKADPVETSNMFRSAYRMFLATLVVSGAGAFLWNVAFLAKTKGNQHTGVIVGFVTATALSAIIGFYFGGQDRAKKPVEPVEPPDREGLHGPVRPPE